MKEAIHPEWHPEAKVVCACGNTWTVGATVPEIRTDICSNCHPFFTGEMRIVDTEGQVDRFMKRLEAREQMRREVEEREAARTSTQLSIEALELNTRVMNALTEAEIGIVGDILDRLAEGGDDALLDIPGFGRQALADVKRALRGRGYELPEDQEESEEAEAVAEEA